MTPPEPEKYISYDSAGGVHDEVGDVGCAPSGSRSPAVEELHALDHQTGEEAQQKYFYDPALFQRGQQEAHGQEHDAVEDYPALGAQVAALEVAEGLQVYFFQGVSVRAG